MSKKDDNVDRPRDETEVLRRMIATPPTPHKAHKRRPQPSANVRQLEKRRTNKKRDKDLG